MCLVTETVKPVLGNLLWDRVNCKQCNLKEYSKFNFKGGLYYDSTVKMLCFEGIPVYNLTILQFHKLRKLCETISVWHVLIWSKYLAIIYFIQLHFI